MDEQSIFFEALEKKATPEDHAKFLDEACAGDTELRRNVEELLRAHEKAGGFLQPPTMDVAHTSHPAEGPGTVIGRYKLLELIGEGGFGDVYMAEQQEPVHRRVALKIIKLGMDTKQVIARFEAERQALAMVEHPNIAKVLDAGATDTGRPYFVMELIRGLSITEHCDQNNLTTKARLELFIDVCHAVQHAHVEGIIHRDIKPSNVIVTLVGGRPVPKVIDFGIAKATQKRLTEKTSLTGDGQFLGTPQYMSPEQAGMSDLHVDIRTDIYSLGVVLYELLVGRTPFDPKQLHQAGYDEVCRIIRETDPPTPSKHLSTLGPATTEVSKRRQVQPAALRKLMRGDLDCIVMKALAKDRDDRYATAQALADDLRRHMQDKPIRAEKPSLAQSVSKWSRRHKPVVWSSVATLILSLVALAASTVLIASAHNKEKQQRIKTQEALRQAKEQKREVVQQEKETARQRDAAAWQLYRAHMQLAQQDWEHGLNSRLIKFLKAHVPQPHREDLRGWEWYFFRSLGSDSVCAMGGHRAAVLSVKWSPDGQRLASASRDKTIKIWDATSGKEIRTLRGHVDSVHDAVWSPDGRYLAAAGGQNKTLRVWDATTGEVVHTLRGHDGTVYHVAWSPNGKYLASSSLDKTVKVWDTTDGTEFHTFAAPEYPYSVAWSPDSRLVACGGQKGWILAWIATTGHIALSIDAEEDVFSVAWSPDGNRLASAGYSGVITLWDKVSGQELLELSGHKSPIDQVSWRPDGRYVASAARDQTIRLWDATTGQVIRTLRGHEGWVRSVHWSPNGNLIASGSLDGLVKIWQTNNEKNVTHLLEHAGVIDSVAWNSDSSKLASLSREGTVKIWDVATQREILTLEHAPFPREGTQGPAHGLVWSWDGKSIAAASYDGLIRVWDATNGEELASLQGESNCLVWSRCDERFLAGSSIIHSAKTGRETHTTHGHTASVEALACSSNGKLLASGATDGKVKIWQLASGREICSLEGHAADRWIRSLAWSNDNRRIASASWDQTVKIWDITAGSEICSLRGHSGIVESVAWSPDGRRLATASWDEEIKIWDAATGQEILTFRNHAGKHRTVAWSPDGVRLAAGSDNGTIMIWDASRGFERADAAGE